MQGHGGCTTILHAIIAKEKQLSKSSGSRPSLKCSTEMLSYPVFIEPVPLYSMLVQSNTSEKEGIPSPGNARFWDRSALLPKSGPRGRKTSGELPRLASCVTCGAVADALFLLNSLTSHARKVIRWQEPTGARDCNPRVRLARTIKTPAHPGLYLSTNQTHQKSKMSAPNVDKPNEGIVGQITNSVTNAVNYVSESIQGTVSLSNHVDTLEHIADPLSSLLRPRRKPTRRR